MRFSCQYSCLPHREKKKKLASMLARRLRNGETQNLCFTNKTKCRSTLLIQIWILAAFYTCNANPPIDTGGCSAQQLTRHCEISTALCLHEKFVVPFLLVNSPYSVFPWQGTYWETNASVSACRIALHLKSVVGHSSATRFSTWQGGIWTQDDEYSDSCPLCLIFFICSDHVWNQSY